MKQNVTKKIATAIVLLFMFTFTHVAHATTCANAIAISATLPASGSIVCGTADDINAGNSPDSGDPDDDDFKGGEEALYTFTPATSGNYVISLNASSSSWTSIWVFNGCPTAVSSTFVGVTATSSGSKELLVALTAGTTYYIMFDTYPSPSSVCEDGPATYSIIVAPPAPASCATLIAPANAATNVAVNPAPTFSWSAVPNATGYHFYIGTSVAGATLLLDAPSTTTTIYGFQLNTTYYWYVVPFNVIGEMTGCDASASSFTTAATVANDDCAGAIPINQSSGVQSGGSYGASQSQVGCLGDATFDIWYKTTTTAAGDLEFLAQADNGDVVLEVFSGTCGALTSLGCVDIYNFSTESFDITGAAANTTYYFRLYEFNGSEDGYSFLVSGSALPVTMDKLKGQLSEHNLAQLTWKTLSEQNNKGFEIQRSVDGSNFRTVGFVGSKAANGNSKEAVAYNFTDAEAVNGTVYYRLQQTDIDGKTALSNTVRLSAKENGAFEIVAVPNPVKDKLSIRTYGVRGDNARVLITDLSGKVVRQINVTADEANVDMSSVANGIYLLKYTDATRTQTIKVSKQ